MKYDQLKKTKGILVQLVPAAWESTRNGTGWEQVDDDWFVEDLTDKGVSVENRRTQHKTILGFDHIHNFTTNPARAQNTQEYGFFQLRVQLFVTGVDVKILPTTMPGIAVPPNQLPRIPATKPSSVSRAAKLAAEEAFDKESNALLRGNPSPFDQTWSDLCNCAIRIATEVHATNEDMTFDADATQCVVYCNGYSMQFLVRDRAMGDHSRAYLLLRLFDGRLLTPQEIGRKLTIVDPRETSRSSVAFRRDQGQGWCWFIKDRLFTSHELADHAVTLLLERRRQPGGAPHFIHRIDW